MQEYSKERLSKLKKLIDKETPCHENSYDSDDDMYGYTFKEHERIDFSDQQENWHSGVIDISLEEMVMCVSQTAQNSNGN